jgi:hypothetical protein
VIVDWSSAPSGSATPAAESVTLLLREQMDADGWRVEYRTLPSAITAGVPDGRTLLEDPFIEIAGSSVADGPVLFQPAFNDLAEFTIRDPIGFPIPQRSLWAASAGVVTQSRAVGTQTIGLPVQPAQVGTHLVGGEAGWSDIALAVRLRSDIAAGAVGVLFRYIDENNYYRFSMATDGPRRRLVKREAGVFTLLWEDTAPVVVGQDYDLRIEAVGGNLRVLIDGGEVCAVRDTAHLAGRIALYAWRCRAAAFTQLTVSRRIHQLPGWEFIDVGPLANGSTWQREGGALGQTAPIAGTPPGAPDPSVHGSYAVAGDPTWTDIRLDVRVLMEAPDAIGVALRWNGPENHLQLVLDARLGTFSLIRHASAVTTTLWSGAGTVLPGVWRELTVEAIGTRLRAMLDGIVLFDLHDASQANGQVGLYVCATGGCRFARFKVRAAEPKWFPYATVAGIGPRAAGRRVRISAGREADAAPPPMAAEVRRFLDFLPGDHAGVRLPEEGVDLRVLAPDGRVVHARRFPPDAAFAPEAVSVLRAADGTGLIVVTPSTVAPAGSMLPPGIYRFDWTFRRDNAARDPGSLILSENGDRADEVVRLDLAL